MALTRKISTRIKSSISKTKTKLVSHKQTNSGCPSPSSCSSASRSRFPSFSSESLTSIESTSNDDSALLTANKMASAKLSAARNPRSHRSGSLFSMPSIHRHTKQSKSLNIGSTINSAIGVPNTLDFAYSARNSSTMKESNSATDLRYLSRDDLSSPQHTSTPILLPIDPEDKAAPPCTAEDLTPIIPMTAQELQESLCLPPDSSLIQNDELIFANGSTTTTTNHRRPLIVSNLSSISTAATFAPSTDTGDDESRISGYSLDHCSKKRTHSNAGLYATLSDERYKDHIDPVFLKSNQIDHFDKHLDRQKNDKLADQMALNILNNISEEEETDELARFKAEISSH